MRQFTRRSTVQIHVRHADLSYLTSIQKYLFSENKDFTNFFNPLYYVSYNDMIFKQTKNLEEMKIKHKITFDITFNVTN